MPRFLIFWACFTTFAAAAPAAEPSDILRYVPRQAEFVTVVDRPRDLVQAVAGMAPLRELMTFEAVKEQFDSTNSRRFRQLVAHFEKTLDRQWPDLLDDLTGGGAALALRFDPQPPPAMLVIKAKNEDTLRRAFDLFVEVVKTELERAEKPEKIETHSYRGFTGYKFSADSYAAVCGPVLFFSNKAEAVKAGIDLCIDGSAESLARTGKAQIARKFVEGRPVAWTYLDLDRIHNMTEAQEAYRYPRGDPGNLAFLQGITDVTGKSPFVALGHYASTEGLRTTIYMAAGREATPAGLALHLPPEGRPGSLPLLAPKNTVMSMSYFLDLGKLWNEREKLFVESTRKEIEGAEQKLGRFLGGRKLSEMLTSIGTYHRFVVVTPEASGYTIKPDQVQPAFAFVTDMRDPKFAEGMNTILRATALVAGLQVKLKMTEEKVGPVTMVCYRFPEEGKIADDANNNRFNFSPCFARVGDQFMVCSTVELARELIGLLSKPETNDLSKGGAQTWRMRLDAAGGAELVKAFEDRVLTQTILNDAMTTEQARKEVAKFMTWLRGLGQANFEIEYGSDDFRYDIFLGWGRQ
ncbi:MAG: hypothetical protein ACJ8C4_19780 [Gemmataceae bacterium]